MFYSRKRLTRDLLYANDYEGYVFPFAGPLALVLTTIYRPFTVVSLPFNIYWFYKFKNQTLEKKYNLLATLNIWAATKAATWSIVSLLIFSALFLHEFNEDQIIMGIIIFQVVVVFAMYFQANQILKKTLKY